jgi:hypothetical protein
MLATEKVVQIHDLRKCGTISYCPVLCCQPGFNLLYALQGYVVCRAVLCVSAMCCALRVCHVLCCAALRCALLYATTLLLLLLPLLPLQGHGAFLAGHC